MGEEAAAAAVVNIADNDVRIDVKKPGNRSEELKVGLERDIAFLKEYFGRSATQVQDILEKKEAMCGVSVYDESGTHPFFIKNLIPPASVEFIDFLVIGAMSNSILPADMATVLVDMKVQSMNTFLDIMESGAQAFIEAAIKSDPNEDEDIVAFLHRKGSIVALRKVVGKFMATKVCADGGFMTPKSTRSDKFDNPFSAVKERVKPAGDPELVPGSSAGALACNEVIGASVEAAVDITKEQRALQRNKLIRKAVADYNTANGGVEIPTAYAPTIDLLTLIAKQKEDGLYTMVQPSRCHPKSVYETNRLDAHFKPSRKRKIGVAELDKDGTVNEIDESEQATVGIEHFPNYVRTLLLAYGILQLIDTDSRHAWLEKLMRVSQDYPTDTWGVMLAELKFRTKWADLMSDGASMKSCIVNSVYHEEHLWLQYMGIERAGVREARLA